MLHHMQEYYLSFYLHQFLLVLRRGSSTLSNISLNSGEVRSILLENFDVTRVFLLCSYRFLVFYHKLVLLCNALLNLAKTFIASSALSDLLSSSFRHLIPSGRHYSSLLDASNVPFIAAPNSFLSSPLAATSTLALPDILLSSSNVSKIFESSVGPMALFFSIPTRQIYSNYRPETFLSRKGNP